VNLVSDDPHHDTSHGAQRLFLLAAVLLGLFAVFQFLPVDEYIGQLLEWTESLGAWGPVVLAAIYVVGTVLMVPGVILSLGAGFAFDLVVGVITISVGSTLGAIAAFLIGRTLARGYVEQLAARHPKFAAIDRAVEASGFKIVLLTRLSPVFPFNLLNYLLSVTKVRTRDYALASWIGMMPGTVLFVYLGKTAKDLSQILRGDLQTGIEHQIVLALGLLATIVVTVYVTRVARRALTQYVEQDETA
jgi:uncharacterized membrane protein YdjX (TVP38/TMEM64 family)